ncbi:MAG: histidine kinase [Pseudomonadota bacterium]
MNAPDAEYERMLATRTAHLNELVAHLAMGWDDERRKLARQLHDTLGSTLTALTMHLGLLNQRLPDDPALLERSAQMKKLLMNMVEANRALQASLWNDKLEFLGIKVALAELAGEFAQRSGLRASASLPEGDIDCPREHAVLLLRCAEEGLRNAEAHAQASALELVVDDGADALLLTVRDNGIGPPRFDPEAANCHGLRLLRERAAYFGGTLVLANAPDGGAALTLTLPK